MCVCVDGFHLRFIGQIIQRDGILFDASIKTFVYISVCFRVHQPIVGVIHFGKIYVERGFPRIKIAKYVTVFFVLIGIHARRFSIVFVEDAVQSIGIKGHEIRLRENERCDVSGDGQSIEFVFRHADVFDGLDDPQVDATFEQKIIVSEDSDRAIRLFGRADIAFDRGQSWFVEELKGIIGTRRGDNVYIVTGAVQL